MITVWRSLNLGSLALCLLATCFSGHICAAPDLPIPHTSLARAEEVCKLAQQSCSALMCRKLVQNRSPQATEELALLGSWLRQAERSLAQILTAQNQLQLNNPDKLEILKQRQVMIYQEIAECQAAQQDALLAMEAYPRLSNSLIDAIENFGIQLHQLNTELENLSNLLDIAATPTMQIRLQLEELRLQSHKFHALFKHAEHLHDLQRASVQKASKGVAIASSADELRGYIHKHADLLDTMTDLGETLRLEWLGRMQSAQKVRFMVDIEAPHELELWLIANHRSQPDMHKLGQELLQRLKQNGLGISLVNHLQVRDNDPAIRLKLKPAAETLQKQLERLILAVSSRVTEAPDVTATISIL